MPRAVVHPPAAFSPMQPVVPARCVNAPVAGSRLKISTVSALNAVPYAVRPSGATAMLRSPAASATTVHPLSAAARTHDVGTGRQLSAPAGGRSQNTRPEHKKDDEATPDRIHRAGP